MTVGEPGFKQRSYQHRAAGSEHAVVEPVPVPGRVGAPAPALHPAGHAASSARTARGALRRLATGVALLDDATRTGRAASPMLVLDVRSALTRADAALAQCESEVDPTWGEIRASHAELAPRARIVLDAQAALATPDATAAALAADVETMAGRVGLGRVDVRADAAAQSITEANSARGVALGQAVYLHPGVVGTDEGNEVLAHELIHLAQSRLTTTGDHDRDAAEAEAATLAPGLARGASIRPSRFIDLARPAADSHATAPKVGLDAVARAGVLLNEACMAFQVIYGRYQVNESADVASLELVAELASVGKTLWYARQELLSDATLSDARKQLIPVVMEKIDTNAKQVEALEMQLRGASETAEAFGERPPAPAKHEVRESDGPVSARAAQAHIAATPIVGDAIARGPYGETFGKMKVVFHDDEDSFAQAYVDVMGDAKSSPDEIRAKAKGLSGFTHPSQRVPHVLRPGGDPCTTIHEILHAYSDGDCAKKTGRIMHEGVTDYATRMVCRHNRVPFRAGYPEEIVAVEALVSATSEEAVIGHMYTNFSPLTTIVDSKGPGTWKKFKKHFESGNYLLAMRVLDGVRVANEDRVAAEIPSLDAGDARVATRLATAPPASEWGDEGTVATGKIFRDELTAESEPYVGVRAGGKGGVRVGWSALVPLRDGTTVVGKVVDVSDDSCRIVVPDGRDLKLGSEKVYLWRSS